MAETLPPYFRQVIGGDLPATDVIRRIALRHAALHADPPGNVFFDAKAVRRVLKLTRQFRHTQGSLQGQPFSLMAYQTALLADLFGWRHTDDPARNWFNRVLLFVPRQAGKTTFNATMLAAMLVAGPPGTSVISAAPIIRQSERQSFATAVDLIQTLPESVRRAHGFRPKAEQVMWGTSSLQYVGRNLLGVEGVSAAVAVFDEAALVESYEGVRHVESGQASRPWAVSIMSSTAQRGTSLFRTRLDEYMAEIDSPLAADHTLCLPFMAPDEAACADPDRWAEWNPSIADPHPGGVTQEGLEAVWRHAKKTREGRESFFLLNCNRWDSRTDADAFSADELARCAAPEMPVPAGPVAVGVDLSTTRDLTAVACLYPAGERLVLRVESWAAHEMILELEGDLALTYERAAAAGFLHLRRGGIDHEEVADRIAALVDGRPHMVGYDPSRGRAFAAALEARGITPLIVTQTPRVLSNPTRELQRAIETGRLAHDANPLLELARRYAALKTSASEHVQLWKRSARSGHCIDPLVAAVIGFQVLPEIEGGVTQAEGMALMSFVLPSALGRDDDGPG